MSHQSTQPTDASRRGAAAPHTVGSRDLRCLNLYRVYWQILTEDEKRALRLVETYRRSYAVTASTMGIAIGEVRQLVFLARRKLFFGMDRTLRELRESAPA